MGRFATISASMAAVMAITSMDLIGFASSAAARGHGGIGHAVSSFSGFKSFAQNHKVHTDVRRFVPKAKTFQKFQPKRFVKVVPKFLPKGSAKSQPFQQKLVLKNIPLVKPVAATGQFKARLALPANLTPKLTLIKAPKLAVVPKFQPFIQRHWKSAFFWVAVAGIGYLTIPDYYYDRWAAYVDEDEPDYDRALGLLSLAALDEEEGVVRVSKPADVAVRYTAPVAPPPAQTASLATDAAQKASADGAAPVCTLKPFVDRQWSRAYVWVDIPEVGNVTVPEDNYDAVVGALSATPPNFENACAVLAQAAAADTVATAQATTSVN